MNAGAAKLAGQAAQRAFPFMKGLAKSPRSEQPGELAEALRFALEGTGTRPTQFAAGNVGAIPKQPEPWQRFTEMVRGFRGGPNVEVNPMRPLGRMTDPTAPIQSVKFSLEPKGGGSQWHGGFQPNSQNPFEMYVAHLTSDASRRKSIGGESMGAYKADITSPAQRDWGWGKPKPSKQPREARSPEDRVTMDEFRYMKERGYHQPGPSIQEKQGLIDKLLAMARDSGFKSMAFDAEPGERPRLYSKLMGYDFKPTNESPLDQMSRMLSSFPGRQGGYLGAPRDERGILRPFIEPDRQVAPRVRSILRNNQAMDAGMAENVLGLSIDEGIDFGFIRPVGDGAYYQLTDEGRQAAQSWLQGMGQ